MTGQEDEVERAFDELSASREKHAYDVSLRSVGRVERPGPLSVRQTLTFQESTFIAEALDEYGIENEQAEFTHSATCPTCATRLASMTFEEQTNAEIQKLAQAMREYYVGGARIEED